LTEANTHGHYTLLINGKKVLEKAQLAEAVKSSKGYRYAQVLIVTFQIAKHQTKLMIHHSKVQMSLVRQRHFL
jgi:hypothetical protein